MWNCELLGRYVLFLVHMGGSACFEFLPVKPLPTPSSIKEDVMCS